MLGEVNDNLGMEIQRDMMLTFGINNVTQFDKLLEKVVQDIYKAIGTLQSRTDCTPFTGNKICSFSDFSYAQWIRSYLSLEITDQQSLNLSSINNAWVHGQADILDFLNSTILPVYGQRYSNQFSLFMFEPSRDNYHLVKQISQGQNPPANSLWNFKSLNMLLEAGTTYQETTITVNNTQQLQLEHFGQIAARLQVSKEQAFVLAFYLEEVIENVWKNERDLGTCNDIAYLSRWAPSSLGDQQIYTYMRVIPRALYGYSLYNIYVTQLGFNCTTLLEYLVMQPLLPQQTAAICISDLWGFTKPVSWISWVSLFIEGSKGEAAKDLQRISKIDLNKLHYFLSPQNQFSKALESVQQQIYVFYDFCHQPGRFACPDSELVAGQILQSRVSLNFPQFLVQGVKKSPSILTSFEGIELYLPRTFKALQVEAQFDTKSEIDVQVAREAFFRASWLRNTTFYESLFSENNLQDNHKDIKGFIRELIIQNRFKNGFFIKGVSEKEVVEQSGSSSKIDQAILDYQQRSFQDYGIPQLQDPESLLSFLLQGNGLESEVLSGANNIYKSRVFTKYGGSKNITKIKKYLDLQTRSTFLNSESLWDETVYFDFTDGFQLNPLLENGDETVVYFPELRRPVKMQHQKQAELNDVQVNIVSVPTDWLDLSQESSQFGNKVTKNTGVIFNVSQSWNAPAFITKGNFLDYKNREKVPKLLSVDNHIIYGNQGQDDIKIWGEKHSGVVLKMSTNFMLSFEMGTDALCYNDQGPFLAPLLTTGRSMQLTDSMVRLKQFQITARFPNLVDTQKHRTVLLLVFLILGGVLVVVSIPLFIRAALIKSHKIRFEDDEEQEIVVST